MRLALTSCAGWADIVRLHPTATLTPTTSRAWTAVFASVLVYAAWLLAWYWPTVASMVAIWYRSETFVHGFVVLPISVWLIARNRAYLRRLEPSPNVSLVPLLVVLAGAILWMMGELASVLPASHFAWVTMLVAGCWVLLGGAIARELAFPLAFLYFAVPLGEFLLPTLMDWTARFTVGALRLSGVPVLHEGNMIHIPSGSWSVVEACSGLRYLIASVMVGALYAYVMYRTMPRRIAFVAASIAVPIVANWLRAYMIVMIGHLSGNRLAVGVDHLIYGWLFFGFVMALLFWVGSWWREDVDDKRSAASSLTIGREASRFKATRLVGLLAALAVTASAPVAIQFVHSRTVGATLDVSPPVLGGWRPLSSAMIEWTPEFLRPRGAIASTYEKGEDRAGLYVALYFDQDDTSKLVSSSNQLLRTTSQVGRVVSERVRTLELPSGKLDVLESVLVIRNEHFLARALYYIDGHLIASPALAKLAEVKAKLAGRGDAGAIVVVYTPLREDPRALDEFSRDVAASLPRILAERLRPASP